MRFLPPGLRLFFASSFVVSLIVGTFVVTAVVAVPIVRLIVEHDISPAFLAEPLTLVILFLAACFGAARGYFFHPVFDSRYCQWLANTPWTPKHPLPKGPVQIVWADLVVVGILCAASGLCAWSLTPPIWMYVVEPFLAFLVGVSVVWTLVCVIVGQTAHVYAVVSVPIVFALLQVPLTGFFFCPVVVFAIAWHGVRQSLRKFPDSVPYPQIIHRNTPRRTYALVGWPYEQLLKPLGQFPVPAKKALTEGFLAAAWIWFIVSRVEGSESKEVTGRLWPPFLFAAVGMSFWYISKYSPVICRQLLSGHRAASKRWLIFRHDQIFLVPVLLLLITVLLPDFLHSVLGASAAVSCGTTAGVLIAMARGVGPDLIELQYTGMHSMGAMLGKSDKFETASGATGR